MGTEITRDRFGERDYARFRERLERCLADLGELLARPGFGAGPATIGAELEACLVDDGSRPLPRNQAVRDLAADPRIALELNRYNLELNASPVPLAGRPFAALADELGPLLARAGDAARAQHGRIALIGILPTLRPVHLGLDMVTDAARYRALDRGLRRLHRGPFLIRIAGAEPLELTSEHITTEGANTSFQVHLRVAPGEFTRVFNAAQLATAPVLAAAGNSPTFLGRRLWEETRVALFKQSVEDRDSAGPRRGPARAAFGTGWLRGGALELFTESVRRHEPLLPFVSDASPGSGVPPLDELRLHQGTIWRWNRAIYDPSAGGHLRIEMRALPAGPTVTDMLANAAFLIGLTLWLAGLGRAVDLRGPVRARRARLLPRGPARPVRRAELAGQPRRRSADGSRRRAGARIARPRPGRGCWTRAWPLTEASRLLGVIGARVASGQTGAAWQRAAPAAAECGRDRDQALAVMLDRYLSRAATGQPVHAWPA